MADIEITQNLPCPFCGAAISEHDGYLLHPDNGDVVDCPLSGMSWTSDRYRAAWNTRPDSAKLEAEREIVSWLRGLNEDDNSHNHWKHIALRIERGEHRRVD